MYLCRKTSAGRAYLQVVESRRDGEKIRQQVIATLGRYDELAASGQLERLLRSGDLQQARRDHPRSRVLHFALHSCSKKPWKTTSPRSIARAPGRRSSPISTR